MHNTDKTKPKPTVLPRSRETNIGDQTLKGWNDPSMAELNWDRKPIERPTNRKAQATRLKQVIGTQRRQDKEAGLRDSVEYVLDYLIDEGFTDSYDSALVILETMSEQWLEGIIEKFNPEDYKEYHQKDHMEDNSADQWDRENEDYQRERAQRDRQRDTGRRKRAIAATIKDRQRRARR